MISLLFFHSWISTLSVVFSDSFIICCMVITLNLMRPSFHCVQHSVCQICQYRLLTQWGYTGAAAVCPPKPQFDKSQRISYTICSGASSLVPSPVHQKTWNNDLISLFLYLFSVCQREKMRWYLCMDDQPSSDPVPTNMHIAFTHSETQKHTQVVAVTHTHSQMHACLHKCTKRDTLAHAHSLMRNFLTFLHVPQENIDESPFKNNSRLVGSLNDLQLFQQHVIITFIMLDCTGLGHCGRGWTF